MDHYDLTKKEFNDIAERKCGAYDEEGSLAHKAQAATRRRIISWLESTGDRTVCDIGCGKGDFSAIMSSKERKVIGVDFSEKMILLGKRKESDSVKFRLGEVTRLPLSDEEVDFSICVNVLHHVRPKDWENAIGEFCRISRSHVVVEFKNRGNIFYPYIKWLGRRAAPRYGIRENYLQKLLKEKGFYVFQKWYVFKLRFISPIGLLFGVRKTKGE